MIRDDSHHHQPDRLLRTLRSKGIDSPRVLEAMARVPRHRFVPAEARRHAYADHALALPFGQSISQPYMVAAMTEALELQGHERVLEVGTGSGYQCAVLAELVHAVWSVERIPELAEGAAAVLSGLGYANVHLRTGDGSLGWPDAAPFDAILVTAGAPRLPAALLAQMSEDGGRLVAPVGDPGVQRLVVVERSGTSYTSRRSVACRFVPLVGEEGWPEGDATA